MLSAIAQHRDTPNNYYTDLGRIYVDIGGGRSAGGTALRKTLEQRLAGADPVTSVHYQRGVPEPPGYDLEAVKSQLNQDIIDDGPNTP